MKLKWAALLALTVFPAGRSQPNVILITVDTLRSDYVSAYGSRHVKTPVLDALAAEGALFTNAYCQVPLTPPSHASILTGTYPALHGMRDFTSGPLRPEAVTLAETLKEKGYQTAAFVSAFVLDASWGLDRGFDLYYDDFELEEFQGINPGNVQRRAGETLSKVIPWLENTREPFFLWVHLFDPHHDYNPPEPYRNRYASNPYAGEVAYVDSEVGRLVGALQASARYSNALVIVTSDHGESLGEHSEQEHGFFLYETTVRVPLIFKLPASFRVPAKRVETTVQTVDIAPTVLQVLRLPNQPQMQGKGLLSAMLGKASRSSDASAFAYAETLYPRTTFGWSDLRAYREGRYKFIAAPKPELYDLSADPGETTNLYISNKSMAHRLQQKLASFERAPAIDRSRPPEGVNPNTPSDPERLERLSALGYVAVTRPVPVDSNSTLADPKDKVPVFNRILEAFQASEAGKHARSNAILQEVLAGNPELSVVHYSMGANYLRLGDPRRALEAFQQAKKLNPGFQSADLQSARALADLGRIDEGIQLLQDLTRRNPLLLTAKRQLALLYSRRHRWREAAAIYREILSKRPHDKPALKMLGIALVEGQSYEEGLTVLSQAIASGVDDAMIYNFLGIAQANSGKLAEAVSSYRKALEIKPDYDQARLNLSFTLLKNGQATEARREFQVLCKSNPRLCRQYEGYFR